MSRHIFIIVNLVVFASPAYLWAQNKEKDAEFEKELIARAKLEYETTFKAPEKTHEYWAAMNVELNSGKFDLAGYFLREMLNNKKVPEADVDVDLVKIQQAIGYQPFYRLRGVKEWSTNKTFDKASRDNVEALIKRVNVGVDKYLSDPERIKKAIAQLIAPTKEERDLGFIYLQRSGEKALPFMLETLRNEPGTPIHRAMIEAFIKISGDLIPPLREILKAVNDDEAKETNRRLAVIEIFRRRVDYSCMPYLWHLANSVKYPIEVRAAARDALAYLREEGASQLPSAKYMLTLMADKCFTHKLKVEKGGLPIWEWDGRKVAEKPKYMSRREAEEFFGLRYAREALDLDPAYKPAQMILLDFYLERTFDRDLDKFFFKPMPAEMTQLLLGMDTDFLLAVLNRAFNENNVPIILPIVEILGMRGELRAAPRTPGNPPGALVKALYFSDRRVQFAAVNALTKMPYRGTPADSFRVVEVLRRFLASEPISRTLVAMTPKAEALVTQQAFEMGGFKNVETHCSTIAATFDKLRQSADYDVLFVHPKCPISQFPYVLSQLRGDSDQGRLPLIVLTTKDNLPKWRKLAESYPNTWAELDSYLVMPDLMKKLAEEKIDATAPGYKPDVGGFRISMDERKKFTEDSMKLLWKMGRGEIQGYDVRSAQDTIRATLHKPDLASMALEIAARNPDRDTQIWLNNVFFDPAFDKLKLQAITALRQHIQKNGLSLENAQLLNLRDASKDAKLTPEIRLEVSLILGNLRFSPKALGKKLSDFNPPVPMPMGP